MDDLRAVIQNRHRRVHEFPPDWHWFACSCGMKFRHPSDRDDHIIKANEATWEQFDQMAGEAATPTGDET